MQSTAERMRAEIAEGLEAGPRGACSEGERALGRLLEERWGAFAGEARAEAFRCQPHAFLGFIPFVSLLTLAALALLPRWPAASASLAAVSLLVTVFELLLYRELVDPLFPTRTGHNIVARIAPAGEIERRVVLSAHQDAAYEFNLWYWFKGAGVGVNVLGLGAAPLHAGVVGGLAWAGLLEAGTLSTLAWVGALLAPFAALHLLFHTFRVVPGAMDDLAGLAAITAAARELSREGLEHTELLLLGCSAEECGLRGAKRYVAAHREELLATPTLNLNVDGVYDERFLTVITRELTTGVRHSPALIELAQESARTLGQPMRPGIIPFGATDASAFGQAGVETVSLLCQDIGRLAPNYHTRLDTLERVRPEALTVMRDLLIEMVRRLDRP
ncbi:MAG: M20/M25/M40 family metallo-hydrolase [Deltaproteobacteria bacterium]|nr:M20/M25/M40 family metallo-hydrolase [Deltaproteobacteria bacterium]